MARLSRMVKVIDGLRVLVCGGRGYDDMPAMLKVLDKIHGATPIALIIHGAADGADMMAEAWARLRQIPYLGVPAQWKKYNKAAGPIRNKYMLQFSPGLVVAFPGGVGTADMVRLARTHKIPVVKAPTEEASYANVAV